MKTSATLKTVTTVEVPPSEAKQWFMALEEHPERYQFDTHAGFRFESGNFGEPGALFRTRERFHGIRLTLHFKLTTIGEWHFRFRLLRPPLPVWGTFVIAPLDEHTSLTLEIGGASPLGRVILRLPLVRGAIERQIRGEVEHIKASMERVYSPDNS